MPISWGRSRKACALPTPQAGAEPTQEQTVFRAPLNNGADPFMVVHDGAYYQAWLKNAADVLVPVGTFSSSNGTVTLWSGVSPRTFTTITVTIEPDDNDQASSGRRVLIGEVRAN